MPVEYVINILNPTAQNMWESFFHFLSQYCISFSIKYFYVWYSYRHVVKRVIIFFSPVETKQIVNKNIFFCIYQKICQYSLSKWTIVICQENDLVKWSSLSCSVKILKKRRWLQRDNTWLSAWISPPGKTYNCTGLGYSACFDCCGTLTV